MSEPSGQGFWDRLFGRRNGNDDHQDKLKWLAENRKEWEARTKLTEEYAQSVIQRRRRGNR